MTQTNLELSGGAASLASGAVNWPRPRKPVVERRWVGVVAPLVLLGIIFGAWQLTAESVPSALISSPAGAIKALVQMFAQGAITASLGISLRELFLGLAIGAGSGIFFGVLMGRYRLFDAAASPFVNTALATPLPILIPLFIVWFGQGVEARVLFIALSTMWPVLINTAGGIRNVSQNYVNVGLSVGLSERQMVRKIVAPATAPYIFAGLRLGLAHSVVAMIVVELEISTVGIGFLISYYAETVRMGDLISVTLFICTIGVLLIGILLGIQRQWFAWIRASR